MDGRGYPGPRGRPSLAVGGMGNGTGGPRRDTSNGVGSLLSSLRSGQSGSSSSTSSWGQGGGFFGMQPWGTGGSSSHARGRPPINSGGPEPMRYGYMPPMGAFGMPSSLPVHPWMMPQWAQVCNNRPMPGGMGGHVQQAPPMPCAREPTRPPAAPKARPPPKAPPSSASAPQLASSPLSSLASIAAAAAPPDKRPTPAPALAAAATAAPGHGTTKPAAKASPRNSLPVSDAALLAQKEAVLKKAKATAALMKLISPAVLAEYMVWAKTARPQLSSAVASSYFRFGGRMLLTAAKEAGEHVVAGLDRPTLRAMVRRHIKQIPGLILVSGFGSSRAAWSAFHDFMFEDLEPGESVDGDTAGPSSSSSSTQQARRASTPANGATTTTTTGPSRGGNNDIMSLADEQETHHGVNLPLYRKVFSTSIIDDYEAWRRDAIARGGGDASVETPTVDILGAAAKVLVEAWLQVEHTVLLAGEPRLLEFIGMQRERLDAIATRTGMTDDWSTFQRFAAYLSTKPPSAPSPPSPQAAAAPTKLMGVGRRRSAPVKTPGAPRTPTPRLLDPQLLSEFSTFARWKRPWLTEKTINMYVSSAVRLVSRALASQGVTKGPIDREMLLTFLKQASTKDTISTAVYQEGLKGNQMVRNGMVLLADLLGVPPCDLVVPKQIPQAPQPPAKANKQPTVRVEVDKAVGDDADSHSRRKNVAAIVGLQAYLEKTKPEAAPFIIETWKQHVKDTLMRVGGPDTPMMICEPLKALLETNQAQVEAALQGASDPEGAREAWELLMEYLSSTDEMKTGGGTTLESNGVFSHQQQSNGLSSDLRAELDAWLRHVKGLRSDSREVAGNMSAYVHRLATKNMLATGTKIDLPLTDWNEVSALVQSVGGALHGPARSLLYLREFLASDVAALAACGGTRTAAHEWQPSMMTMSQQQQQQEDAGVENGGLAPGMHEDLVRWLIDSQQMIESQARKDVSSISAALRAGVERSSASSSSSSPTTTTLTLPLRKWVDVEAALATVVGDENAGMVAMLSAYLEERREQHLPLDSEEPLLPPGLAVAFLRQQHSRIGIAGTGTTGSVGEPFSTICRMVIKGQEERGRTWGGFLQAVDEAKTDLQDILQDKSNPLHPLLKRFLTYLSTRGCRKGVLPPGVRDKLTTMGAMSGAGGLQCWVTDVETRLVRMMTTMGLTPRRLKEDKVLPFIKAGEALLPQRDARSEAWMAFQALINSVRVSGGDNYDNMDIANPCSCGYFDDDQEEHMALAPLSLSPSMKRAPRTAAYGVGDAEKKMASSIARTIAAAPPAAATSEPSSFPLTSSHHQQPPAPSQHSRSKKRQRKDESSLLLKPRAGVDDDDAMMVAAEEEEDNEGGLGRAVRKGFRKWLKNNRENLSKETRGHYCQLVSQTVGEGRRKTMRGGAHVRLEKMATVEQVRSWVERHLDKLRAMVDDSPSYSTGSSWAHFLTFLGITEDNSNNNSSKPPGHSGNGGVKKRVRTAGASTNGIKGNSSSTSFLDICGDTIDGEPPVFVASLRDRFEHYLRTRDSNLTDVVIKKYRRLAMSTIAKVATSAGGDDAALPLSTESELSTFLQVHTPVIERYLASPLTPSSSARKTAVAHLRTFSSLALAGPRGGDGGGGGSSSRTSSASQQPSSSSSSQRPREKRRRGEMDEEEEGGEEERRGTGGGGGGSKRASSGAFSSSASGGAVEGGGLPPERQAELVSWLMNEGGVETFDAASRYGKLASRVLGRMVRGETLDDWERVALITKDPQETKREAAKDGIVAQTSMRRLADFIRANVTSTNEDGGEHSSSSSHGGADGGSVNGKKVTTPRVVEEPEGQQQDRVAGGGGGGGDGKAGKKKEKDKDYIGGLSPQLKKEALAHMLQIPSLKTVVVTAYLASFASYIGKERRKAVEQAGGGGGGGSSPKPLTTWSQVMQFLRGLGGNVEERARTFSPKATFAIRHLKALFEKNGVHVD